MKYRCKKSLRFLFFNKKRVLNSLNFCKVFLWIKNVDNSNVPVSKLCTWNVGRTLVLLLFDVYKQSFIFVIFYVFNVFLHFNMNVFLHLYYEELVTCTASGPSQAAVPWPAFTVNAVPPSIERRLTACPRHVIFSVVCGI